MNKMHSYTLILAVLILLLVSLASAADVVDQQQTQNGRLFKFAYAKCFSEPCTSPKYLMWAEQSFLPTTEKLTKVELRLITNYNGLYDPCYFDEEKFDVEIRDNDGDSVALKTDIPICGLPTKFDNSWTSIPIEASLTPGKEYKIHVQYKGNAIWWKKDYSYKGFVLGWEMAKSDAYPNGNAKTNLWSTKNDFMFKTWATG